MLTTEWDWDTALAVRFEEGLEEGLEEGMEKGMEKGMETVALNALSKGVSLELISEITGFDIETIKNLQPR